MVRKLSPTPDWHVTLTVRPEPLPVSVVVGTLVNAAVVEGCAAWVVMVGRPMTWFVEPVLKVTLVVVLAVTTKDLPLSGTFGLGPIKPNDLN